MSNAIDDQEFLGIQQPQYTQLQLKTCPQLYLRLLRNYILLFTNTKVNSLPVLKTIVQVK